MIPIDDWTEVCADQIPRPPTAGEVMRAIAACESLLVFDSAGKPVVNG